MPKKKTGRDQSDDDWKTCSFCGESIKLKNYEKHLERVHLDLDDDDIEEETREIRPRKTNHQMKRAELRKQMEQDRRKKQDIFGFIGLVAIVGIILVAYFVFSTGDGGKTLDDGNGGINTLASNEVKPASGTNEVRIPVNNVNDGKAHYYYYYSGGTKVNFFVLKSSDGIVRAAFDACDVCFSEKKGYAQKGDFMVCNNCGQQFASVKINEEKGGCNPAPLDRTVDDSNLIIKTTDLDNGKRFF